MKTHTEKFKSYTNRQLLEMLQESKDYLPEAVEAAKEELTQRNISIEERETIHAAFAEKFKIFACRCRVYRKLSLTS
ncbi:MAG: hypothetical protein AAF696_16560 [Bacteroidota bacterium]